MAGRKDDMPLKIASEIIQASMEEVMHDSMIPYAEHVILERALPRVEDGLKPVQRRILFTMSELAITPDKPHRKCARIVGDCLGKYHPHGDSSVYGALVRMAQPFSLRGTLVDGHGNFGSIDGDSAAAMRYTEARMTPLAMLMLKDLDKDTVSFSLNFDDSLKEPDLLPAYFPNLLVNGADGIAVGLATNIPPHNLKEVAAAVEAQIDNPAITVQELMQYVPAPDFPTGGVLLDTEEIGRAYETGRGKLLLRARVHVEEGSSGRKLLVITEIPYQVSKSAMLEKILKLSEEKKAALGCIYDIRDESDRTGMRAVVEIRKEADPQRVLSYLYKYSDLQITFGVNMVAIAEGKPMQMGLKEVIGHFITHQKNVVTRRTQFDLDQALNRVEILKGLMIALDNLDEVIRLIRASKTPKEARETLMATFDLSAPQAQAILDMRLQRLTNLETLALRKEYEGLLKLIDKLESILKSEKKLLGVIKQELAQVVADYQSERMTTLEQENAISAEILDEAPVPEEAVVVYTHGGYLRRMYPRFYEKLPEINPAETPEELPRYLFNTMTDHTLLFFTNKGNCYPLSVGALPEFNRPKDRGQLLSGVLQGLEEGETLATLMCVKTDELATSPDFLFVTKQGMIKRTAAVEYDIRRSKFAATGLKGTDELFLVMPAAEAADLLFVSKNAMSIRFALDSVPAMGRTTGGVKAMQLDIKDEIILAAPADADKQVLLFSERGSAKRLLMSDFDRQGRNGKGIRAFYFNKNGSNGNYLVKAMVLNETVQKLIVVQAQSPVSIFSVGEIALQQKTDKGKPYVLAIMEDIVTEVLSL